MRQCIRFIYSAVIENNIINRVGTGVGLQTESMIGNVNISDNDINAGGTLGLLFFPAVSLSGNDPNNVVSSNVISADNTPGVYILNSSDALLDCNDITSTQGSFYSAGVWNNTNSDRLDLLANTLESSRDLFTRSTILEPLHKGNCFNGNGVEGQFNSPFDFQQSIFLVDQMDDPCLLPANIEPAGWFLDEEGLTLTCGGQPGPNPQPFIGDDFKICKFLDALLQSYQNPNQKMISINRLISLVKVLDQSEYYEDNALPNCITTFLDTTSLCGIEVLISSDSIFSEAVIGSDTINVKIRLQTSITYLALQSWLNYDVTHEGNTQIEKDSLWTNYQTELSILKTFVLVKETNEDSAWTAIDSIQVIECLDSITTISIKAMKHYSNRDNLSESDKSEIDFYSKKCAQKYGHGVHLMRGLASNFNAIDYTEFDLNCNNSGIQSSPLTSTDQSFDLKDNNNVVIVPNPNNGEFYITHDTNSKITNYDIYNFQGKLVYSNSGSSRIDQKITLNLPSGIFFIRLNMSDNKTIVKRFVVE